MAGYRGRTGPNFSEYLNSLNTISSPYDTDFNADDISLDADLPMFTNTDFTNFDISPLQEPGTLSFDMDRDGKQGDNIKFEDLLAGVSSRSFSTPSIGGKSSDAVPFFPTYITPIQPAPTGGIPLQPAGPHQGAATSPDASQPQYVSLKRKAESNSASPTVLSTEDQSRLAAEEDKRRRNTAASARFRVKKKQREQALERTVKEVQDKNTALESQVRQLEVENKWLKELITEKNGSGNQSSTKEEIAKAYQRFRRESEERETKTGLEQKKTEGTKS